MTTPIDRLLAIMARLRDPESGCPWDVEQTFETIAPYTLEEAYEVVDAIERGDTPALRDELGDLLLQVVFHARIAAEAGLFDFDDVATAIAEKLVQRHPHVFADAERRDIHQQTVEWEHAKHLERRERRMAPITSEAMPAASTGPESVLDDVPLALPALVRAAKLQKRAAAHGFRWPHPADALAKVREEIEELAEELSRSAETDRIEDELGDLLIAVVSLARTLQVDPEAALRRASRKFEGRFRRLETILAEDGGRRPADTSLDALLTLWAQVKAEETMHRTTATEDATLATGVRAARLRAGTGHD